MVTVLDEWAVVDRWWTDDPLRIEYVEVDWDGRKLHFKKTSHDKVWRILSWK